MSVLYMQLEGPLQSWGDRSKFWRRDTRPFPTRSGVTGLLFCAMGLSGPQRDRLEVLARFPFEVVQYQRPKSNFTAGVLTDLQMVGNGYDDADPWETLLVPKTSSGKKAQNGGAKMTYRQYLQDACFAAFMGIPDSWDEEVEKAMKSPKWDLYLGRKSCVPSSVIFHGIYSSMPEARKSLELELKGRPGGPWKVVREVKETSADCPEAVLLHDVPVQFGERKVYGHRAVCIHACESD